MTTTRQLTVQQTAAVFSGYVTNRTPANLKFWTKTLIRLLQYDECPRINMYGDSITSGSGGGYQKNSVSARLAGELTRRGIPAYANLFGIVANSATTATYDPRFAFTGTWGAWTQLAGGGGTFRCTSNAGTLTYTPGFSHNTVNIFWYRGGGLGNEGNMTISLVDGSNFSWATYVASGGGFVASGGATASTTISFVGAASIMRTEITFAAAGSRQTRITNDTTKDIEIYGIEAFDSTAPAVLIRSMGSSGYTSTNLATGGWLLGILGMPCELSMLNVGRNDPNTPISTSTYAANLTTLYNNITANGISDVLYWTWPPSAISDTSLAVQQQYTDVMRTAAGSTIVVADLWQRWTDRGGQAALAASAAGYYNDTIHPSAMGNYDIGAFLADAIMWPPGRGA